MSLWKQTLSCFMQKWFTCQTFEMFTCLLFTLLKSIMKITVWRDYFLHILHHVCSVRNAVWKSGTLQIVGCVIFFRGESHRRITATGKFTQPWLINANCEWACVVLQHSHSSPGCLSEPGWPTTIQRLVMRESIMRPTLDKGCWILSLIGWHRVFFNHVTRGTQK